MDLTNINKLYTPDDKELIKLYDNLGRLIWQAGPPVLWQGSWKMSTTALETTIDIAKYPTLLLQFAQTITSANVNNVKRTSLLITNGMINLPVKDAIAAGGISIIYYGSRSSYILTVSGNLAFYSNFSSADNPVLMTIYGLET